MLKLRTAKKFEKDYEKALRSGKDEEKIKRVILTLLHGKALEAKYHNHKLTLLCNISPYEAKTTCFFTNCFGLRY